MNENNKQYFHFTLGPVQSFVGQARRPRDFWAGSFLLSWLSGVAMLSVIKQQRERSGNSELDIDEIILFPSANKKFLDAIEKGVDKEEDKNNLKQGSIPNRFKATVNGNFKPQQVIDDVQKAWRALSDKIYKEEIQDHALKNTRAIWDRQIKYYWEMTWVLVDDIENSSALDCRKNWRSHYLPEETGIKCSLMGDWQELSGIKGVRSGDNTARKAFWQSIADKNGKTDFTEKEMLCAMSYIKRRFLKYFTDFSVLLANFTAYGWRLPKAVPSVSYIAAAPWFGKVLSDADESEIEQFYKSSEKLYGLSEYESKIKCIEDAHKNKRYKGIDGNAFHGIALDNINTTPDQDKAKPVKAALKKLKDAFGDISPFYAVLMMDGDSLGKQMSDVDKQKYITQGLSDFTQYVPDLVKKHNGFLIYAGGDDVLALVTLEDAFNCALAIRESYEQCFKETNDNLKDDIGKINECRKENNQRPTTFEKLEIKTSISAAIIYTHINSPLKSILHESHQLLDDVAKDNAGRDALAVRVYKGSGLVIEWAKKWDNALNKNDKSQLAIKEIIEQFQQIENRYVQFSSKFFYKIRQRFELLYGKDSEQTNPLDEEQAQKLMAMEYLQSLDDSKMTIETAEAIVKPLIEQCENAGKNHRITADFALLVRFLAQKGIDGGRS